MSTNGTNEDLAQLRSQVATLEQLIEVHEQVALEQNRRLEQTLQDLQNQTRILQSVLNSIGDGVVVANAHGEVVLCNPAAERICGLRPTDMSSMEWTTYPGFYLPDTVTPYPPTEFPLARALRGEAVDAAEVFVQHETGSREMWLSVTARPLKGEDSARRGGVVVFHDITVHKRAEAEQARLQEEIIQVQAALLMELSTPLIPISDHVLVLPLVGSVDSQRAQQMLKTLLHGIAESRAEVVILDITGVAIVDTQVANGLIRAAQAVKLLGAQVVLTGIRPEVAHTLVGLGAELPGIVTFSTLQRGIAFAMERR